jgi:hypothetical protein
MADVVVKDVKLYRRHKVGVQIQEKAQREHTRSRLRLLRLVSDMDARH